MFYKVLHTEIKPIENYNINRAFHYGDGFFESIYTENLQMPLFEYHYNRICKSFDILRLDKSFLPSSESLYDKIISTLIQPVPARIRLDFTREAEGLYLPDSNDVIFTITHKALESKIFESSKAVYNCAIYKENIKSSSALSCIKSKNALIYVLAAIWANQYHLDDAILLNEHQHCIESISSNLFIIRDEKIYTPTMQSGAVHGVMRSFIIDVLSEQGILVIEKDIEIEELVQADEVFISNSIKGIQFITSYLTKNYQIQFTQKIRQIVHSAFLKKMN